ncbi:MAG: hypothetical protein RBR22_08255 [Desulfuromonas sp.]|nr:hypothetical protein [Desulfuromonas sp.]
MQGFKPRDQRAQASGQNQSDNINANNKAQSNQKKAKPISPRVLGFGAAAKAGFALSNRAQQIEDAIGYANGGMIRGPGTGTSDDIEAKMPTGSYIMPADSTEQVGEESLEGLGSPANVRVSNGEYQLPPEQVHAVGVQALDQIKNQTHAPTAKGFNPKVSRDDEQFFNQGGQVLDEDEAKRKALLSTSKPAPKLGQAPASIALTPQQQNQNKRDEWRKQSVERQNQFKANASEKLGAVTDAVGTAYGTVLNTATAIPQGLYGVATGEIPVTFDDRLPRQDIRDKRNAQASVAKAKQWVATNPDQAAQSRLGMQGIADLATSGLNIPPKPLQGIGGAPMTTPQQAGAPTQQPQTDPVTGQTIAPQPAVEQGVAAQPANEPAQSRHGTDVSRQQPKPDPETGYVTRTDQQRRDFARSNKVDGVPMLDSNMAKTIDPNSINTMSSTGMMGLLGSQSSEAVNQALKAAADRGDWGAVQNHYAKQGQSFGGQGLNGIGRQGKGPRVTVVRDPTRAPSNAELMNQRLESARLRNADAGRRTDIEGQRVFAGIGNDQFRNQILDRQTDISGRGQDLAERQAEPTIAQQQRLQSLYAEYDAADDAGKARIAQQINQLNGKNDSIKDNFLTAGGGQEWNERANALQSVPQRVIDLRTGQEIGGNSGAQNHKPMPQGSTKESIISDAQKKIKAGVSKEAINNRLAEYGIDPL